MEYTIEIPSQGANTFSSFVMYIVERDQPVYITNVVVSSGASAGSGSEPGTDGGKVADFSNGAFEGATVDTENEIYTFTGQDWAGWANNADIYPLSFEEGGTITFTASAATPTNVRFRFEYQPYPNVDPAYDTEQVLINSADATEYTIEIPSQGANTFSSFVMYLAERDQPVMITNIVVTEN